MIHRKPVSLILLSASALALTSCASLGGNIKGDFVCRAPGGSCAPSIVIDDQALAQIGEARPMPASQTSPWMMPRSTQPSVAQAGNGVVNTAPRVTQVVFPAFVDSNGYLHEARKVKMVSQAGTWVQLADGAPTPVAQMLGSASVDPALAGFRLSADPVALSQSSNDPSMPSADAVIKARTKAATKLPTTQQEIEAAVASKLVAPQQASKPDSSVPVNTPASFPGKVD